MSEGGTDADDGRHRHGADEEGQHGEALACHERGAARLADEEVAQRPVGELAPELERRHGERNGAEENAGLGEALAEPGGMCHLGKRQGVVRPGVTKGASDRHDGCQKDDTRNGSVGPVPKAPTAHLHPFARERPPDHGRRPFATQGLATGPEPFV